MKPDEARLLAFYQLGLVSKNHSTDTKCTNDAMRFALEAEAVFQRALNPKTPEHADAA